MTLLLAALPAALAGWTATVEAGEASPAELAALAPFLDSCPARPDDWIARYADGALLRFGPVAGHDQRDAEPVEDCLRAALAAKPIAGTAVLRLRWTDPTLDRYRQNVTSVLDQLRRPRSDPGCTTLRFPIQADNTLGAPLLAISSGDPDFDARVTASLALLEGPLPPLPESLRAKLGDTVDVCVQGGEAIALLLWELPQTALGALVYLLNRWSGNTLAVERVGRLRVVEVGHGAVSLGWFVFWSQQSNRYIDLDARNRAHEMGHAAQSRRFGPLYLLVVGLPSVLRASWLVAHLWLTGRKWPHYYRGWPENDADRLGGG